MASQPESGQWLLGTGLKQLEQLFPPCGLFRERCGEIKEVWVLHRSYPASIVLLVLIFKSEARSRPHVGFRVLLIIVVGGYRLKYDRRPKLALHHVQVFIRAEIEFLNRKMAARWFSRIILSEDIARFGWVAGIIPLDLNNHRPVWRIHLVSPYQLSWGDSRIAFLVATERFLSLIKRITKQTGLVQRFRQR